MTLTSCTLYIYSTELQEYCPFCSDFLIISFELYEFHRRLSTAKRKKNMNSYFDYLYQLQWIQFDVENCYWWFSSNLNSGSITEFQKCELWNASLSSMKKAVVATHFYDSISQTQCRSNAEWLHAWLIDSVTSFAERVRRDEIVEQHSAICWDLLSHKIDSLVAAIRAHFELASPSKREYLNYADQNVYFTLA